MPKFEATCAASIFKHSLKSQLRTGIWKISSEGLRYQGYRKFDVHHKLDITVMAELYLSPAEFKKYECNEEFLMTVNLDHFKTAMNCSDWSDSVVMIVEENTDRLDLIVFSERSGIKKSQTFELEFIPDEVIQGVFAERLDYVCELEMSSERFRDLCAAIRKISNLKNDVKISMMEDRIVFESAGCDECLKSAFTVLPRGADYSYKSSGCAEGVFRNAMFVYPAHNVYMNERIFLKFSRQKWFVAEYRILKRGHLRYYMFPLTDNQVAMCKGNTWRQLKFSEKKIY